MLVNTFVLVFLLLRAEGHCDCHDCVHHLRVEIGKSLVESLGQNGELHRVTGGLERIENALDLAVQRFDLLPMRVVQHLLLHAKYTSKG